MPAASYIIRREVFRRACLKATVEQIYAVWVNSVIEYDDRNYKQGWSFVPLSNMRDTEPLSDAEMWLQRTREIAPKLASTLDIIGSLARKIADPQQNIVEIQDTYIDVMQRLMFSSGRVDHIGVGHGKVSVVVSDEEVVMRIDDCSSGTFLQQTKEIVATAHAEHRWLSTFELLWLKVAERLLDHGESLSYRPVPYGLPGHRKHQTAMAVTDPGYGHLLFTCTNPSNMDGVTVHLEHLERGIAVPRADVEPYRMIMPRMAGRVALRTAGSAPLSAYVGRPMFEKDQYRNSFLKTVHTFAAACSHFFQNGFTECKIAVEGMTASQAIEFLSSLSANVVAKPQQIIAAAFCLNVPFTDDRTGDERLVDDPLGIALLGIDIANAAKIKKIAWDGSSDRYPSVCIIDQIGFGNAVRLVHEAHELGLLTYFSAGFKLHDIANAVYTGVDGVGIGGAQVLRYMDYQTGNHGPFQPFNLSPILFHRNQAEASPLGRAAKMLAMLDQLKHEQKIDRSNLDVLRKRLYAAIRERQEDDAGEILRAISAIVPRFLQHPVRSKWSDPPSEAARNDEIAVNTSNIIGSMELLSPHDTRPTIYSY